MLNNLSERPVFHGTMGNRLVAPVVFVCFAILVATVAEGGQRLRFQKTFEGDCEADVQPRLQVEATAGPNLGGGPPKVVVALGTTVQLTGVAHKVTVDERCRAKAKKVAPTWTLSFRAPDGSPVDLTASLRGGNGLSPTFVPTESGAYVARLEAGGKRVDIEIEVLGDPVASSSTAEGRATPSEVRWVRHWNSIGPNGDPGDQGDGYRNSGQMVSDQRS
jgi:hypothetical protein